VSAVAVAAIVIALFAGAVAVLWPTSKPDSSTALMSAGFSWNPGHEPEVTGMQWASVWVSTRRANISRVEVRMFDAQFNFVKKWEINKDVLVAGSGQWDLPDDFRIKMGGAEAFVDACFQVDGQKRSIGYFREISWPKSGMGDPLTMADRKARKAVSAKTSCDYVL
jgi:hypothetical protein